MVAKAAKAEKTAAKAGLCEPRSTKRLPRIKKCLWNGSAGARARGVPRRCVLLKSGEWKLAESRHPESNRPLW
eukprot:10560722-Alexandrium_andersonii.AAC.1